MNYLTADKLSKYYGDKVLFDDLNFSINAGQKVALIAKNGAGKSSLLKILTGKDTSDGGGSVLFHPDIEVGYLQQEPELDAQATVLNEVLYSDNPMLQAIRAYEESLLSNDPKQMEEAIQLMDSSDAWDYESKIKQILSKLNIHQLDQEIGSLSGGQQKRVALAKLLIRNPDMMILDEPTNHLDLDMIEWLEEFLIRQKMTLFMVTHDRYFLGKGL
jgi:ATPase components of ABC transporters with duplicated ATPase domains